MKKNLIGRVCLGAAILGLILGMAGCGGSGAGASSAASSKAGSAPASSAVSSAAPAASSSASSAAEAEATEFKHPDGWSTRYYKKNVQLNKIDDHSTSFVYTGECAGTSMITVTYDVGKDAKTAIADLAKSWGENASTSEAPFLGNENIPGYWATLSPAADGSGSGYYSEALARDYMDGALIFELDGHMGEDEENNMAVSDALAGIIDSLEFPYEEN